MPEKKSEAPRVFPGEVFPEDWLDNRGKLVKPKGFVNVHIPLDKAREFVSVRHPGFTYSEESDCRTPDANDQKAQSQASKDARRTAFFVKDVGGESPSFVRVHPGGETQLEGYGSAFMATLEKAAGVVSRRLELTADEAQALFIFAVQDNKGGCQQGGQYVFLNMLFSEIMNNANAAGTCKYTGEEDDHFAQFPSPFYLIDRNNDGSLSVSVLNAMTLKGGSEKPRNVLYHCSRFILTEKPAKQPGSQEQNQDAVGTAEAPSFRYHLKLDGVEVIADATRGIQPAVETLNFGYVELVRNELLGGASQEANGVSWFLGGLLGGIVGFVLAPVIYLALAFESFHWDYSGNLAGAFLEWLGKLGLSFLMSPWGAIRSAQACAEIGVSSAFSPQVHFAAWLSSEIVALPRRGGERWKLYNRHKNFGFEYVLLSLAGFLMVAMLVMSLLGVLPLPVMGVLGFVLTFVHLPVTAVSLGLLGAAASVVGGVLSAFLYGTLRDCLLAARSSLVAKRGGSIDSDDSDLSLASDITDSMSSSPFSSNDTPPGASRDHRPDGETTDQKMRPQTRR